MVPRYWVGWLLYPGLALSARRAAGATAGAAPTRSYLGRPLANLPCTGRHLFGLRRELTNVPPNLFSLEPRLDSLQADVYRVRISPGFACPSCLVQSRCLRSVTVGGRRLRFVLLVVGPEVLRVITHSDRGLGWNLVSLRTRGITR